MKDEDKEVLAREFDSCGECRLEIGGPKKYKTLSDAEIQAVVDSLRARDAARIEDLEREIELLRSDGGKMAQHEDAMEGQIIELEREVAMLRNSLQSFLTVIPKEILLKLFDSESLVKMQRITLDTTRKTAEQYEARVKAEALKEHLPLTADGVPIVPDMIVYCIVGEHVDKRRVIGPYGKKALLTFEPQRYGCGPGSCHRLINTVYAKRDAAELRAKGGE